MVSFDFVKEERRVGTYYFYVLDREFGLGFIKICTYFPYPAKVWLNGHEWAKRQAARQGSATPRWPTGSRPAPTRRGCRRSATGSAPPTSQAFFDRWIDRDPDPVHRRRPRRRLLVGAVDAPGRGLPHARASTTRAGRGGSSRRSSPTTSASAGPSRSPPCSPARLAARPTKDPFRTRIFTPGTEVKIDFSYKHSRVKQYLKEGRALRIETVINKPSDIGVLARLEHLPELVDKARAGQRPSAYDRTCRSGLCHRLCALRAHPPALHTGGPTNRSLALRGSTRHGPGRRPLPRRPRRHRLHQQKPSRARRRTPRHRLQLHADELRPAPPPTPRPDRTPPAHQHLHRSPPTASASPSSTPNSTPGSSGRSSTPTNHPPRSNFAAHSEPLNPPSTNTSKAHASHPPPKVVTTLHAPTTKSIYSGVRDFARNRWPLRGSPADTRG